MQCTRIIILKKTNNKNFKRLFNNYSHVAQEYSSNCRRRKKPKPRINAPPTTNDGDTGTLISLA